MTAEPRTEAGKRLLFEYQHWFVDQGWEAEGWDPEASASEIASSILDIEAEAPCFEGLDAERLANAYNNVMYQRGFMGGVRMDIWRHVVADYAAPREGETP